MRPPPLLLLPASGTFGDVGITRARGFLTAPSGSSYDIALIESAKTFFRNLHERGYGTVEKFLIYGGACSLGVGVNGDNGVLTATAMPSCRRITVFDSLGKAVGELLVTADDEDRVVRIQSEYYLVRPGNGRLLRLADRRPDEINGKAAREFAILLQQTPSHLRSRALAIQPDGSIGWAGE